MTFRQNIKQKAIGDSVASQMKTDTSGLSGISATIYAIGRRVVIFFSFSVNDILFYIFVLRCKKFAKITSHFEII